jgi:putative transposase
MAAVAAQFIAPDFCFDTSHMTNLLPQRRWLRLRHHDYAQAGMSFVTGCTHDRAELFELAVDGEMRLSELSQVIEDGCKALPAQYACVCLDEFVAKPNHLHRVVVLDTEQKPGAINRIATLRQVVRAFKACCTRSGRRATHGAGSARRWQRNDYEQVVCNDHELVRLREYIRNTPAQRGLGRNNPNWEGHDKTCPYGL